jgi:hypothetical protein
MSIRRLHTIPALGLLLLLASRAALARGDGTFLVPLEMPDFTGPVWAAAADLNGDGSTDLAVVNGSSEIRILLQDPSDRTRWTAAPSALAGNGPFFITAADLDGDQAQDLAVADPGSSTYILWSRGDGTFETAMRLPETSSSRVVYAADFTGDGILDLVSLDSFQSFSIHIGRGARSFEFKVRYDAMNCHDLLVLDFEGNGIPDIMAKTKETGIFPFQGRGDGSFLALPLISNLTVRGPIAAADFNGDGKGDLMTDYGVGISQGDGTYQKTLELELPFAPVGAGDLTSDGFDDAMATDAEARSTIQVYPGLGDGRFLPAVSFTMGAYINSFFVADIDGDGMNDLVVSRADLLSIIWGVAGERLLAGPAAVAGLTMMRAFAAGDFDRDGTPDIVASFVNRTEVRVILEPGKAPPGGESRTLNTSSSYASLELVDLDGDEVLDLVGTDPVDKVLVALIDGSGGIRSETALNAGTLPASPAVGRIDEGSTLDVAVPCTASNHIAVFLGQGGGELAVAIKVPTITGPRALALGDVDLDGRADLVIAGSKYLAIHFGKGGAEFEDEVVVATESKGFLAVCMGDLDLDGQPDLVASSNSGTWIWRGKGNRELDEPKLVFKADRTVSLSIADLDGDGLPDLVRTSQSAVSVSLNQGAMAFSQPADYSLGFAFQGHLLADFDADGATDIAVAHPGGASLLFGRAVEGEDSFRRGDVNGDGPVNLSDAVSLLMWLFVSGEPPRCHDAADANHDGRHDLSDAVAILNYLFLGGGPPPAPGPADCGPAPEPSLGCESYRC